MMASLRAIGLMVLLGISLLRAQQFEGNYRLFEFSMKEGEYAELIHEVGKKIDVKPTAASLNGQPIQVTRLHVRGQSSLFFRRKSFTLHLAKGHPIYLQTPQGTKKLADKFYLLSLSMDRHYFHNRLAFLCLNELGLFPLFNAYAEVRINGESQGVYLIVEKPEDYVLDELKGVFILRVGPKHQVDEYSAKKSLSRREVKSYLQAFRQIKKVCRKASGRELQQALSELMDLEAYMKWLAFNYWVHNGDYSDEVYYYALKHRKSPLFSMLPWDYDDIFVSRPHEGWKLRNRRIGQAMIFSSEDLPGRTIARDSLLYRQYLQVFKEVLDRLPNEKLEAFFRQIDEELTPYFSKAEVVDASRYDQRGPSTLEDIRKDMQDKLELMKNQREGYRVILGN